MDTLSPALLLTVLGSIVVALGLLIVAVINGQREIKKMQAEAAAQQIANRSEIDKARADAERIKLESQAALDKLQVESKAQVEAANLANEAAELRRKAEITNLGTEFARQLQDNNQKLQDTVNTLTINFTAQIENLKGQISEMGRQRSELEKRLQSYSEQKYEAFKKVETTEKELEAVQKSEKESRDALVKANELNQAYAKREAEDQARIDKLSADLLLAEKRLSAVETELNALKKAEDDRHIAVNAIQTRNMQLSAAVLQFKTALNAILEAIPMHDLPPAVTAELHKYSIDLGHLVAYRLDEPLTPTLSESPA